jgi:hypothetical protein
MREDITMYFPEYLHEYDQATKELPFADIPSSQWTPGMREIWAKRAKAVLADDRAKLRELTAQIRALVAQERTAQPFSEEEEFRRWWARATPAERAALEAEARALEQHTRVKLQFAHAQAMGRRRAQDEAAAERRRKAAPSLPLPTRSATRPAEAVRRQPGQEMTLTRNGMPYYHRALLPTHLT